jgi:K+/H+ antiporter YhaU regulatory subunit KhtT
LSFDNKINLRKRGNKMITTLIILALIIVIPFLALTFIKVAADRDFIWTKVREGTAKAVVGAGNKFVKFLWQYNGYKLITTTEEANKYNESHEGKITTKREMWDIAEEQDNALTGTKNLLWDKLGLGGIQYYGLPGLHQIYSYKFRWNSLRQNEGPGATRSGGGIYFQSHSETLRYILLQADVYYARLEQAEDQRMIPLDVDFTIAIRIKNPYKALFKVQDWLEYVWGQILPAIRQTIRSYYDWIEEIEIDEKGNIKTTEATKEEKERMKRIIWEHLNKEKYTSGRSDEDKSCDEPGTTKEKEEKPSSIIAQIREYYGIKIDDFTILRIDATGERKKEIVEMATKVIEVRQNAKATRIDYIVEVERLEAIYGKIRDLGPTGELIRRLEAFEKSSKEGTVFVSAPELTKLAESAGNLLDIKRR